MRNSLKDLVNQAILFKYNLPNLSINKSKISTVDDSCYFSRSNDELAEVIYNAIIDYAFDEYRIKETDFKTLHRLALTRKLKFNDSLDEKGQLKFGFYGEVLLYCILCIFYESPPVISRGHIYQILENGETKGYDAYHLVDNQGALELWFGEVKFYANFKDATTGANGAITNLSKAISDDYLNTNLIAISERMNDLAPSGEALSSVLKDIRDTPEIKISDLSKKYNIKLVYPILILFDEGKKGYDDTITTAIQHIEDKANKLEYDLSLELSIFFIFTPVNSARDIKLKVLEWIKNNKQLIS